MNYWLLTGNMENWEKALSEGMWGVTENFKGRWEELNEDDSIFLYAVKPIAGIIGLGIVKKKLKQDRPLWREEIKAKKVIWPYRFEFSIEYSPSRDKWSNAQVKAKEVGKRVIAGITQIKDQKLVELLLRRCDSTWETSLYDRFLGEKEIEPLSIHDKMKHLLLELGRFENYITEKEYPFPDLRERIDVVWRRVPTSVPTFVFEVQVGGNMHQALSKLKHAFDLWNSNIYIVTNYEQLQKIDMLTSGAFHEIRERLRVLTINKIEEIHSLQKRDYQIKREIGFK
jgi:hypothetical protein